VSWLDKSTGVVHGGTIGVPGLSKGDYELELNLGFYGSLTHKFTVGDKAVRAQLKMPRSRKLVKVRLIDDAGQPIKAVPVAPDFSDYAERLPARKAVLPEPVLRLPPQRSSKGGFQFRRARGGGGKAEGFALSEDGYFYVTVFNGGKGTINIPLGEEWFGKKQETIDAPFEEPEYEVRVSPTDALRQKLAGELSLRNEEDPGYKKARAPSRPSPDSFRSGYVHKLTMTPTIRAWARACEVADERGKTISCRYTTSAIEFAESPETLGVIFLWPRGDGVHIGTLWSAEDTVRKMRASREDSLRTSAWAGKDGMTKGVCFRVLNQAGEPVRFVEATLIPVKEESQALNLRKLEQELAKKGKRPPAPETLSTDVQDALREAADEEDEAKVESAVGKDVSDALQTRENRLRYATYGAWYNSFWRMDGDADGYVVAPHVVPEEGEYALHIWGPSRDDLKTDFRLLIEVTGETTDLGVIRLPR
jgi:hypothetical protein